MAKQKVLTYETKCRRCGKLTEWYFSDDCSQSNWTRLHEWVFAHFNSPSICKCKKCEKNTLQDYTSYTDKSELNNKS